MEHYLWTSLDYDGDGTDLLSLFSDQPHLFFLDSSQQDPHRGRYSFIGFDPFDVFQSSRTDSLDRLRLAVEPFRYQDENAHTSLSSGIVGYISYEYGCQLERVQHPARPTHPLPQMYFGFYDVILTIDHFMQKLYVTSSGWPEQQKALRRKRAQQRLDEVEDALKKHSGEVRRIQSKEEASLILKSNFTRKEYMQAVEKALTYIEQGEIYQVNLSQEFSMDVPGHSIDGLGLMHSLRDLSPSSFGAYFKAEGFEIISSSPERFLHLNNRIVQTRPMKGTRPRGASLSEDKQMRQEITSNRKERAELLMITDLERNDLGKVCDFGSVRVRDLRSIEEYKTVFQATSTVEGHLRNDADEFDLLAACLPGGSITGCPKIRAMQIINELEPSPRGIYTGTLGYISFNGQMDFNILIRTLLKTEEAISFHVGSGIVADSTPEAEYEETLVKAKAMQSCLNQMATRSSAPAKI